MKIVSVKQICENDSKAGEKINNVISKEKNVFKMFIWVSKDASDSEATEQ